MLHDLKQFIERAIAASRAVPIAGLMVALAAASIMLPGFAASASAPTRRAIQSVPDHYIVVFNDFVTHPGNLAESQVAPLNGEVRFVYRHALSGYSAIMSRAAAKAIEHDPRVAYVEQDAVGGIASQTTPTGINRIFGPTNSALSINGSDDVRANVDVAVLDSGIDYKHPDLSVVARVDCSKSASKASECLAESGTDDNSHGTHVAGTIAAIDNASGVAGSAPGARLWAIKVTDSEGGGELSEYIAGIDWVTAHASEIEVANSSLRYFVTSSAAFTEAMKGSIAAGVVHVVAAGNEHEAVKYVPGNYPDAITVSAIADYDGKAGGKGSSTCANYGLDDRWATFSNFGSSVDIAAPGVCIYSTLPGATYGYDSGTSMAAPHVAGSAAVLAIQMPTTSKADVEAIRNTLRSTGNFGWTDTSGDGIQEPLLDVSSNTFSVLPPACDSLSQSRIKIGDMNGDGKADIFRFTEVPDAIGEAQVWRSEGKSFTALGQVNTGFGLAPEDRLADWDGDGDDDVFQFTDWGRVDGWRSNSTSYTQLSQVGSGFSHPCETKIGDINGDGKDDILRFNNFGNGYGWLSTGTPNGYSYKGLISTGFGHSNEVKVGDIDGDGYDDLFQFTNEGNGYLWRNNAGVSFTYLSKFASGFGSANQVRIGDRNGDGLDDLFRFSEEGNGYYWQSNGDGTFSYKGQFTSGFGPSRRVRIADINGDLKADILWFSETDGTGQAWLGDGTNWEWLGQIGSGFGKP
jgi:subtilisin family serine protease